MKSEYCVYSSPWPSVRETKNPSSLAFPLCFLFKTFKSVASTYYCPGTATLAESARRLLLDTSLGRQQQALMTWRSHREAMLS